MLPSAQSSSTPVTTTACGAFQFIGVNTSVAAETVASERSDEVNDKVTADVGRELSTTLKLAAPPASVVTRPEAGETEKPAVSSSTFTSATSAALAPPYAGSALDAMPVTTE